MYVHMYRDVRRGGASEPTSASEAASAAAASASSAAGLGVRKNNAILGFNTLYYTITY